MPDDPTDEARAPIASAAAFVASLEEGPRRRDAERLLAWFTRVTTLEPIMWTDSIIGFGRYRYRYASGREGEHFMVGFSPRGRAISIHILPGYRFGEVGDALARLGKHRLGKSCLYVTRLDDIDLDVLAEIVTEGIVHLRATHETCDH